MDTHSHHHSKTDIDEWLLKELIVLDIIRDASHLSRECGKNPTYFACMRARGYGLHLGSLIFLSARLSKRINETQDPREGARLRTAVGIIRHAIEKKCMLREQELFAS